MLSRITFISKINHQKRKETYLTNRKQLIQRETNIKQYIDSFTLYKQATSAQN